jgi:hypothetical protein
MVLQPFHEGEVIGEASKESHGCMGVAVDESWKDDASLHIQGLGGSIFGGQVGGGADFNNFSASNGDGSGIEALILIVESEDQSVDEEKVCVLMM